VNALGMIETRGLVAMIEAADAMVEGRQCAHDWLGEDRLRLCHGAGAWRCRCRARLPRMPVRPLPAGSERLIAVHVIPAANIPSLEDVFAHRQGLARGRQVGFRMILARVVGTIVATRKDPPPGRFQAADREARGARWQRRIRLCDRRRYRQRRFPKRPSSLFPAARRAWRRVCKDKPVDASNRRHRRYRDLEQIAMFPGARGRGRFVSTMKDAALKGQRMLIVQPLKPDLTETGKPQRFAGCRGASAPGRIDLLVPWEGIELSVSYLMKCRPTARS